MGYGRAPNAGVCSGQYPLCIANNGVVVRGLLFRDVFHHTIETHAFVGPHPQQTCLPERSLQPGEKLNGDIPTGVLPSELVGYAKSPDLRSNMNGVLPVLDSLC